MTEQSFAHTSLLDQHFLSLFIFERQRERERERETETETETETERVRRIPSMLHTVSMEPDAGLKLMNHKI